MRLFATITLCATLSVQTASADMYRYPVIYPNYNVYTPIFTNPSLKVAITGKSSFTNTLVEQAYRVNPLFVQKGTQIHMFYWSGPGNHGSAMRLIDTINAIGKCGPSSPQTSQVNCAIWDEGVPDTGGQIYWYPEYFQMNVEHWYDRVASGPITIFGKQYPKFFSIDLNTANLIWGQYSARYAEMATVFNAQTGNVVDVWCFVQGARAGRVFYAYEYPTIEKLEAKKIVKVHCAKNQNADWQNPDDWTEGLGSAACPPPSSAPLAADTNVNMSNYK